MCLPVIFVSKGFVVDTVSRGLLEAEPDTVFDRALKADEPAIFPDLLEESEVYECDLERVPIGTER